MLANGNGAWYKTRACCEYETEKRILDNSKPISTIFICGFITDKMIGSGCHTLQEALPARPFLKKRVAFILTVI
jgi:hypothetical protein